MSKADTLLKKATFFERLAIYSDRKSFLQALSQQNTGPNYYQYPEFQQTEEFKQSLPRTIPPPEPLTQEQIRQQEIDEAMKGPADITFAPDRITAFAPIPRNVQEHLSSLVALRGWGIPLSRIDGKIGPSTTQALNNFKSKMKLPLNTPNAQVFSIIEKEYAKDHPAGQNLEEAAKAKEQYERSQFYPPGTKPPV